MQQTKAAPRPLLLACGAGASCAEAASKKSVLAWSELTSGTLPSCEGDQGPGFSVFAFCLGQINAAAGNTWGPTTSLHPWGSSHSAWAKLRVLSGPAASDSIYRLEKQEKVFDMFFSCAREKCITCPINLLNRQAGVLWAPSKSGWIHASNRITQRSPIYLFIQNQSLPNTNEKLKPRNSSLLPAAFNASKTRSRNSERQMRLFQERRHKLWIEMLPNRLLHTAPSNTRSGKENVHTGRQTG